MGDPARIGRSERELGVKEGRIDATLEDHTRSLVVLRALIDELRSAVLALTETVRVGLGELKEEGARARLAVKSAADALAEDASRRRVELETTAKGLADTAATLAATQTTSDRHWTKRQQMAALLIAVIAIIVGVYFNTRPASHFPAPTPTVTVTIPAP